MKKTKFRGISKKTGQFIYGMPNYDYTHIFNGDQMDSPDNYEVIPETISQFSEFFDKAEKEIYARDIMYFKAEDKNEENGYYEIFVEVVFRNGAFGWIGETTKSFIPFANEPLSDHKIIGNIHQHRHLLNF